MASCYYAQVPPHQGAPQPLDGSLLVRLTPAAGASQSEPDEERHVPWLGPAEPDDPTAQACVCDQGQQGAGKVVIYSMIPPAAGTLVVFPAWLSHSVAPTRAFKTRAPETGRDKPAATNTNTNTTANSKAETWGAGGGQPPPRVSFAANWDFQTPLDDYPAGWRWWPGE